AKSQKMMSVKDMTAHYPSDSEVWDNFAGLSSCALNRLGANRESVWNLAWRRNCSAALSLAVHDDLGLGELFIEPDAPPEGPPIEDEQLHGAPVGYPANDDQALLYALGDCIERKDGSRRLR